MAGAVVRAGQSITPTNNPACGSPVTPAQAAIAGGTIHIKFNTPMRARYVSVDIPGSGVLQLCEVMVEEYPIHICTG